MNIMFHRLYCSSGNTLEVEEYVCYSELDDDGYWMRYVEITADGKALRYSREHLADSHGVLPEGTWDDQETAAREYGTMTPITDRLFEAVWAATRCVNDVQPFAPAGGFAVR
ncbi:hypothetical protein [Roseateles asaccharophilus]|uniref:Uncharacterized protein n=1 Tax=Roseateles asaccharophilus TaxID=582607 RepID=A0ABU2A3U8_9BURK|nr:hypothetical protein [Roseateles asaccharophilus]MDR7331197.1 hypothetical protein [Roseateles asaccharophilus]